MTTATDDVIAVVGCVEGTGGRVKERDLSCEAKWLILCFTLLHCTLEDSKVQSILSMHVKGGGYAKIQTLIWEVLQFRVSERSIQRIHNDFNNQNLKRFCVGRRGGSGRTCDFSCTKAQGLL